MTIDTIMAQIETYYGTYENTNLRTFVKAYLLKDYKQERFEEILKSVLYYHKANFGAPCIATIEECIKNARIEKSLTDPHKGVETKNKWNYEEQAKNNPEYEKVNIDLMSQIKIKRV